MPRKSNPNPPKKIESLKHEEAKRPNIPTAEHQSVMAEDEKSPIRVAYDRRNQDLDPQLVWRGKDGQDWSNLVVSAPPLYIQEKIHPKVLIEDLINSGEWRVNRGEKPGTHSSKTTQLELFSDFNGLPKDATATEFYRHDANWTNRMILGDSLQVMASLSEREGLRGRVQCIYLDPPYGIKFNSNFQWSTTSRDVKDGKLDHITREPEQVKAFRDTWRDGIHSYLTYLRDRLTVARDLLSESGSIFVQIGDENVHRVRAVMDEVFGEDNFVSSIWYKKNAFDASNVLSNVFDNVLWYSKTSNFKIRKIYGKRTFDNSDSQFFDSIQLLNSVRRQLTVEEKEKRISLPIGSLVYARNPLTSDGISKTSSGEILFEGKLYPCAANSHWKTTPDGINRLICANRIAVKGSRLRMVRFIGDNALIPMANLWSDTGSGGFVGDDRIYVVQTDSRAIERCILMTTDPGDLVLDPTCGSGSTAYVAEQWGRRWITIDTSRVALALARARIMGARYPYYLLADSETGQKKEAELRVASGEWLVNSQQSNLTTNPSQLTTKNIRHGFVYERVPHITLKSIANNTEIDVIWDKFQPQVQEALDQLNAALNGHKTPYKVTTGGREGKLIKFDSPGTVKLPSGEETPANALLDWEVPREAPTDWPASTHKPLEQFWKAKIARQKEIDKSIAAKADQEFLYDKPYEANNIVRVAGPFTVESLSPHQVLVVDQDDNLVDPSQKNDRSAEETNFVDVILETLKVAGVQQAHKENKIDFTSLTGFPGKYICAEGTYLEGDTERRAGVFIGPEFGTVGRADLVAAAREAGEAGFDVLISCAFSYDAHSADFTQLGRIPVLKARMNADLHMATDLKDTKTANLFCIFGEPDIVVASEEWLVDSMGTMVAPYEIFKIVSGLESLAEIDRLSRTDLWHYAELSCRTEIWDYIANAAGINIHSSQHCGGTSTPDNWRISSVSWDCARLLGGTGNLPNLIRKIKLSHQDGLRELISQLCGNQQNVKRTHKSPGKGETNPQKSNSSLTPSHSPLATSHYSQITIHGVDVFHPGTGEVRSSNADEIACWFIDTDYNEESFFVRHAYFLGANDPYKSLKTTLKAEIDEEAWSTLHSDTSRPFNKPKSGRIAVKVINHLGDEVMKVFSV